VACAQAPAAPGNAAELDIFLAGPTDVPTLTAPTAKPQPQRAGAGALRARQRRGLPSRTNAKD